MYRSKDDKICLCQRNEMQSIRCHQNFKRLLIKKEKSVGERHRLKGDPCFQASGSFFSFAEGRSQNKTVQEGESPHW